MSWLDDVGDEQSLFNFLSIPDVPDEYAQSPFAWESQVQELTSKEVCEQSVEEKREKETHSVCPGVKRSKPSDDEMRVAAEALAKDLASRWLAETRGEPGKVEDVKLRDWFPRNVSRNGCTGFNQAATQKIQSLRTQMNGLLYGISTWRYNLGRQNPLVLVMEDRVAQFLNEIQGLVDLQWKQMETMFPGMMEAPKRRER